MSDQHFGGLRPPASVGASPLPPQSALAAPITFVVGNNRTRVYYAPAPFQHEVFRSCAYETQTASALKSGWRPPEADFGEAYWDGWVRLSSWSKTIPGQGSFPTGLLQHCLNIAWQMGFTVHVVDERVRPEPGVPDVPRIPLFDYQEQAVERAITAGSGVLDKPPRAGKTRTAIELVRRLWLPTLWVAPTTNIVQQTVRAFDELIGKNFATQAVGKRALLESERMVIVCTAATAAAQPAEFYANRRVLIIDEVHHGAAQSYHDIAQKAEHIFYRYGMSGTFTRSGNDEIALHALLSNVIFSITTTELVQRGRLTPMKVAVVPVDAPAVKATRGAAWLDNNGVGKLGITANETRNGLAAWAAANLLHHRKKTIVLVATKDQGEDIAKRIEDYVPMVGGTEFKRVEFVSTNRPPEVCRKVIDAFTSTDEVQCLIGTSMIGEGTDLPSADALVYAPGGKAEVSHRQAMFRVATAYPGKRFSIVIDFADRHHDTLMQHALERVSTYFSEPIAEAVAFQKAEELPAWLAWIATVAR